MVCVTHTHTRMQVLNRMSPMVGNRITVQSNRNEAHMVIADGARLYQVIHVVLVNAFKYTRKVGYDLCASSPPCLTHTGHPAGSKWEGTLWFGQCLSEWLQLKAVQVVLGNCACSYHTSFALIIPAFFFKSRIQP